MAATPTAKRIETNNLNLKEQVVSINRVTKVVKGGKNLSFSALVVVGDPGAKIVGFGTGKAKEVPNAIKKAVEAAKNNLIRVPLISGTLPHPFNRPPGCPFHPRCPDVMARCSAAVPSLQPVASNQLASCFLHHDKAEPA